MQLSENRKKTIEREWGDKAPEILDSLKGIRGKQAKFFNEEAFNADDELAITKEAFELKAYWVSGQAKNAAKKRVEKNDWKSVLDGLTPEELEKVVEYLPTLISKQLEAVEEKQNAYIAQCEVEKKKWEGMSEKLANLKN